MTAGKGFTGVSARGGYIFEAVLQVVGRERSADLTGKVALFSSPRRRAVVL